MQFGPAQIQIFTSLALILGASLVALICDYLKGHNEKLRELAVELKVRREESDKLVNLLTAEDSPLKAAPPEPAQQEFSPAMQKSEPEPGRALSRAEAPGGREAAFSPRAVANLAERKRISADAMAAIVRGVQRAGAGTGADTAAGAVPKPAPEPPAIELAAPAEILQQVVEAAVARREAATPVKQPLPKPSASPKPASLKKDWNSLLAAHPAHPALQPETASEPKPASPKPSEASGGLLDQIVAATAGPKAAAALPQGMQTPATLKQLQAQGAKVSGLVVAIAVASPAHAETDAEFPDAARAEILSLLEPGEFAASSGPNEFVLIAPAAQGAAAQRRLSRITQHLWDVQLASLGQFELQFTWGGLEVREEPIQDAIESAVERMQETLHSRKLITLAAAPQPLRKAV